MPEKTFINNGLAEFEITILIRAGEFPDNQNGTVSFTLEPGESKTVPYGSNQNLFLNGIMLFTIFEGDLYSKMHSVTLKESKLDNLLNTNDTIFITSNQIDYVLSGSNEIIDSVNNPGSVGENESQANPFGTLTERITNEVTSTIKKGFWSKIFGK